MPTSPKTAKDILEEIQYAIVAAPMFTHDMKQFAEPGDKIVKLQEVIKVMRAAVEAVLKAKVDLGEGATCNKCGERYCGCSFRWNTQIDLDGRIRRFFNDDPTSPPTPPN